MLRASLYSFVAQGTVLQHVFFCLQNTPHPLVLHLLHPCIHFIKCLLYSASLAEKEKSVPSFFIFCLCHPCPALTFTAPYLLFFFPSAQLKTSTRAFFFFAYIQINVCAAVAKKLPRVRVVQPYVLVQWKGKRRECRPRSCSRYAKQDRQPRLTAYSKKETPEYTVRTKIKIYIKRRKKETKCL